MTTGQLLRWEVNVKIPVCLTHPTWEEWEVKAQGWKLAGTVQKAALEALTTLCEKHADLVTSTAAKVIPLPKQHSGQGIEREVSLSAHGNPHYSTELDTAVRFSKAMLDLYQSMVGESMFYRHQIYRQQVNGAGAIAQELKEARAAIANLKKKRRKDKRIIQELSEVIHEQNFLLQHNDQYMLDLENQLEAVAAPPPNPEEEENPEEIQGESGVEYGPTSP
jgi:arylamine N-acetyltransferase